MRTQTDRAPRDLNEIASDQNVVKIMLLYFQKNYGFPMLRSTQNDEKSLKGRLLKAVERSAAGFSRSKVEKNTKTHTIVTSSDAKSLEAPGVSLIFSLKSNPRCLCLFFPHLFGFDCAITTQGSLYSFQQPAL